VQQLCWGAVTTMTLRVLYFAGLRDALGVDEETLELPPGVRTVGALADHLAARHRAYAERRGHVRIARNEAFATDQEPIADGDVVALIPPVAGG
jgi:molybdopterin synthase sulfur carrier subunit